MLNPTAVCSAYLPTQLKGFMYDLTLRRITYEFGRRGYVRSKPREILSVQLW